MIVLLFNSKKLNEIRGENQDKSLSGDSNPRTISCETRMLLGSPQVSLSRLPSTTYFSRVSPLSSNLLTSNYSQTVSCVNKVFELTLRGFHDHVWHQDQFPSRCFDKKIQNQIQQSSVPLRILLSTNSFFFSIAGCVLQLKMLFPFILNPFVRIRDATVPRRTFGKGNFGLDTKFLGSLEFCVTDASVSKNC